MKKAVDSLSSDLKSISVVLNVLDARCPLSSMNPILGELFKNKPIIYLLNKEDLSSVKINMEWISYFQNKGINAVLISCKTGAGRKKLLKFLDLQRQGFLKKHQDKYLERKALGRNYYIKKAFRIGVVGVPNAGKSSVINILAPQKRAKTGKKPGLTRGKQWLKLKDGMEILDSPGIMPPRIDLPEASWKLGAVGIIKQEILPVEEIVLKLISFLINKKVFNSSIFGDSNEDYTKMDPLQVLKEFTHTRRILKAGGRIDVDKACIQILKMFREGKTGRISLERPEEFTIKDGEKE